MEDIDYRIKAWWSSGRAGIARTDSARNAIHFSAPPHFGGLQDRWTPEDLLLAAVASCYITTFRVLAEYSQFEYVDLEVEVDATASKSDSGYQFSEIVTRPSLTIKSDEGKDRANRLLEKTRELCLVARALSVPHLLEFNIQVGKTSSSSALDSE